MEKLALRIGEEFRLREKLGIESVCLKHDPATGECIQWKGGLPAYSSLGAFISAILPNIYIIAGVILFILLVIGGLIVITSAGKAEQEGVQKGQKAITAALVGFLIIFASYWIMQIIKFVTGLDILGF